MATKEKEIVSLNMETTIDEMAGTVEKIEALQETKAAEPAQQLPPEVLLMRSLARAQAKFQQPKKNCDNPYFKSKYADLAECMKCILPALNSEGLFLTQEIKNLENSNIQIDTIVFHEAGASRTLGTLVVNVNRSGNVLQNMGGALTYGRRYAVCAAFGLSADDDDDGNSGMPAPQQKRVEVPANAPTKSLDEIVSETKAKFDSCNTLEELSAVGADVKNKPKQARDALVQAYRECKARLEAKLRKELDEQAAKEGA